MEKPQVMGRLHEWSYDATRSGAVVFGISCSIVAWGLVYAALFVPLDEKEVSVFDNFDIPETIIQPYSEDYETASSILDTALSVPNGATEAFQAMPAGVGIDEIDYEEFVALTSRHVSRIALAPWPAEEKEVALALLFSLQKLPVTYSEDLLNLALRPNPPRYANVVLSWFYYSDDDARQGLAALRREALAHEDAKAEQLFVVQSLYQEGRTAETIELLEKFGFEQELIDALSTDIQIRELDFQKAFHSLWQAELRAWQASAPRHMALLGLGVWFSFVILQMLAPGWKWRSLVLTPVAVMLGAFSVIPTLFAVYIQDSIVGMSITQDPWWDLLYCVLGIGWREELAKLICVAPLLPLILGLRRLDQALLCGCVGLGFAVQENLQYFRDYSASIAYMRVLTANILHMSLTGIAGLALCDLLSGKTVKEGGIPLLLAFLGVVVLHGVYDLFLMNEALMEVYVPVAGCLAISVIWYFSELRKERGPQLDPVSAQALLACGISLVFAVSYVYGVAEMGLWLASGVFFAGGLWVAMVIGILAALSRDVQAEELYPLKP
ncbi:MAG: PrsW family glutamic-type intramembrane protease [Verrucomicrobiales bacterium]